MQADLSLGWWHSLAWLKIIFNGPYNLIFDVLQVRPQEVKAVQGFSEDGKLTVEEGDHITVLEGR